MFAAMKYSNHVLHLVDQRKLPHEEIWIPCTTLAKVAEAIEVMVVRGAPAIGCAAAYGLVLGAREFSGKNWGECRGEWDAACERMSKTRPTAVNLFYAIEKMQAVAKGLDPELKQDQFVEQLQREAQHIFDDDVATCQAIGKHGADLFSGPQVVLTHCNTGSLATAAYGTALGVIRALHERGQIKTVFADETRPYLQGSRLTAFELEQEKIPYEILADGAATYAIGKRGVTFAVVGADRIAGNGDTANKIGTYGVAVACKHHGIPFYVAAPLSTVDISLSDGEQIPVEQRHADEVRQVGGVPLAPVNASVYNPSFDVTPNNLIAGIITEAGVLEAPFAESLAAAKKA